MTKVESRPGLVRRVYNCAFEVIKGFPPDLYQEFQEIEEQFRKAQEGEITHPAERDLILRRRQEWYQKLHDRGLRKQSRIP